jgi:membrane-bound lytic murein transglycosylase B
MRTLRRALPRTAQLVLGTAVATALLVGSAGTGSAAAATAAATAPTAARPGSVETAEAAASRARARVDALLERYQAASVQVDEGVAALSAAFAANAAAEVDHQAVAAREQRLLAMQSAQVRAVYVAGGPTGVTMSVLGASSPDNALWRASTADRVLGVLLADTRDAVTTEADRVALARHREAAADTATQAQADALEDLQKRAVTAGTALAQARATLDHLDRRARDARAARESARQIAAAQAAAQVARRQAMGTVTALGIPAEYQQAYQAAARTCPGMSWTLLAAVGQVETGHGRNNRPSSAGAIGPMQFMPRTFTAYAVDGDQDGVLDAWDPQDAVFSAAHYLCESGNASKATTNSAAWKHAALFAYNRAEWYVDLVLAAEQAISAKAAARP